ncbi:MAG: hypothetical protein ACJ8BW_02010 [Ktedonobacteraceae bacterium]|jgi:hypothetical protein
MVYNETTYQRRDPLLKLPKSEIATKLNAEILSALRKLDTLESDSKEYGEVVDRIAKLHELKTKERPKFVSADTALTVAANLIGIYWLTTYERSRPITSKAINFILRPNR